MTNYIKSELYRITHTKTMVSFTAILVLVSIFINVVLALAGKMDGPSFPYNTTSFSYSTVVANPMIFCYMSAIIPVILYSGNRKNGTLKNAISSGISRTKIFFGECIVSTIASLVSMVIVLAVYIMSAIILLRPSGPVTIVDLFSEVPAILLIAIASLISSIVCNEMIEKDSVGIIVWAILWVIVPQVFYYIGLRFEMVYNMAMLMPYNLFGTSGMTVNTSQSITVWSTMPGMLICVMVGLAGILVFSLSGMLLLKKTEV